MQLSKSSSNILTEKSSSKENNIIASINLIAKKDTSLSRKNTVNTNIVKEIPPPEQYILGNSICLCFLS